MKQREIKELNFDQTSQLLFTIFPLSSPSAHSEMFHFDPPPPKKKMTTTLSEPKANSEERQQSVDFNNSMGEGGKLS